MPRPTPPELLLPPPRGLLPPKPVSPGPVSPEPVSPEPASLGPAFPEPLSPEPRRFPPNQLPPRLLLLGGTTEAAALARALAAEGRWDATLSLAGRTRVPAACPLPVRVGGFGGAAGLAAHLRAERVAVLVDATHPFATRIAANAVAAAREAGVTLLRLERPGWTAGSGDRWTVVPDLDAAARALDAPLPDVPLPDAPLPDTGLPDTGLPDAMLPDTRTPRRVLLTTGQELAPFLRTPWHHYVVRCIEPPPVLPPGAELILARGPFALADELRLLEERGIDRLVTKNAGGTAVAAKLLAARARGVPVVMVARPGRPPAETVGNVAAALCWLRDR